MDIKTIIRRHGETVYTVAEKMGIKQPSLSNIINGNPTVKKLEELARAIGCSPAEFFEDWYENEGKGAQKPSQPDAQPAASAQTDNQQVEQEELPFGQQQPAASEQPQGTTLVGLVRCPQCGRAIRLFAEE